MTGSAAQIAALVAASAADDWAAVCLLRAAHHTDSIHLPARSLRGRDGVLVAHEPIGEAVITDGVSW